MNIHLHPLNDNYPPWESATNQWCFAVPFQLIVKSSCPLVLKLRARFLLPFVAVSLGHAVLEEGGGRSMVGPLLSSLSEILDQGTSFWRPPVTQLPGMWSQYWQDTPTDHMVCVCVRACQWGVWGLFYPRYMILLAGRWLPKDDMPLCPWT
jgi:hypothetical protein